jgi:hypothetical protein
MVAMTTIARTSDADSPDSGGRGSRCGVPWRALSAGAIVSSGEGMTIYLHPGLGEILVTADVIASLIAAITLFFTILFGSREACERAFRLLRWLGNHPEPPAPPDRPESPEQTASNPLDKSMRGLGR